MKYLAVRTKDDIVRCVVSTVILLPAHPASFAHNFVFGMQSFISASPMMQ